MRQLLLWSLWCLTSLAGAQVPLKVAVDAFNPPFMYADAQGQAQGLYVDQLRALATRSGLALEITPMPWKRALAGLDSGAHAVAGIYANPERQARYLYSLPLHREVLAVYARKSDGRPRYTQLSDLFDRRVGVLSGWFYSEAFTQARQAGWIDVEEVSRDIQNVDKLRLGRLDYLIGIRESIEPFMGNHLEPVGVFAVQLTYLALPRTPAHARWLARLNPHIPALSPMVP